VDLDLDLDLAIGGLVTSLPISTTLNDLECPIQLKVRFTHGTLDVVYVVAFGGGYASLNEHGFYCPRQK